MIRMCVSRLAAKGATLAAKPLALPSPSSSSSAGASVRMPAGAALSRVVRRPYASNTTGNKDLDELIGQLDVIPKEELQPVPHGKRRSERRERPATADADPRDLRPPLLDVQRQKGGSGGRPSFG